MKKLLVVLLALTFVVAMATAAFAVTTATVDGKVELTLTDADQISGSVDGKLVFDLAKDYGDGYKAGLKIKITPSEAIDEVTYDGAGWIEITKDLFVLTLKTDLNGNAANDLGSQCDLTSGPGLQIVFPGTIMEGLTLTGVVNELGLYYNYMLKAVYAADPLTVGFGYQANTVAEGAPVSAKDMMAVWAGYKLGDALSFGLEYGSRPGVGAEGASAILVKADYTAAPLTINGKFRMNTGAYDTIDDGDIGDWSAWNVFINGVEGMALKLDASYQITDALKVALTVEDILSNEAGLADNQLLSYKLSVTDVLSEQLTVDGWYQSYEDASQIGVKATYTLVAGLVTSLEVDINTPAVGDATNTYKATITATL